MLPVQLGWQVIDQKHTIPPGRHEQSPLRKLHGSNHQLLLTARKHFGRVDPANAHPDIGPMRPTLREPACVIPLGVLAAARTDQLAPASQPRENRPSSSVVDLQQFRSVCWKTG
jgi:hypothetical protein